jgi:hypothetical protein
MRDFDYGMLALVPALKRWANINPSDEENRESQQ